MSETKLSPDFIHRLENALRLAGYGSAWLPAESINEELQREIQEVFSHYNISTEVSPRSQNRAIKRSHKTPSAIAPKNDRQKGNQPVLKAASNALEHRTQIPQPEKKPIASLHPEHAANLDSLHFRVRDCQNCDLCMERKLVVFGQGNLKAEILFIGDYPDSEDDRKGIVFFGKAGKLLTQMIHSIGINRDAVYLTSLLKCHPVDGHKIKQKEIDACLPILKKQIELLKPIFIVTLGNLATKALIPNAAGINQIRGQLNSYLGISVIPTYHPAYLFKRPSAKTQLWTDMRKIRQLVTTNATPRNSI